LHRFLEAASKDFELMAYTAGSERYARPILDHLDPEGTIFRHRLYSDEMYRGKETPKRGIVEVKDLMRFNRPIGRIVLVDNSPMNFLPQLQNGVPIDPFYDDQSDTALTELSSFLDSIKNEPDVRPVLARSFNLEGLLGQDREEVLG
jgi:TFIIF-interacting CTD phosphatase-like protein